MRSAWLLGLQGRKEKYVSFLVWQLGLTSCQKLLSARKCLSLSNLATLDSVALRKALRSISSLHCSCFLGAQSRNSLLWVLNPAVTNSGYLQIGLLPPSGKRAVDRPLLYLREITELNYWV